MEPSHQGPLPRALVWCSGVPLSGTFVRVSSCEFLVLRIGCGGSKLVWGNADRKPQQFVHSFLGLRLEVFHAQGGKA